MPIERYMEEQTVVVGGKVIPSGLYTQKGKDVGRTEIPKKDIDKEEALEVATVVVSSGKVFHTDTESRTDLISVIQEANELGASDETETDWKLAEPYEGSKIARVTFAELKEARGLALRFKGSLVL